MAQAFDRAQYDGLKAQGLSDREIARRWEIPWSSFRREKAKRGASPVPVQRAVQSRDTGAVSSVATGAVQWLDTGSVQRIDALEQEVQGLHRLMQSVIERLDAPPVQEPVQISTLPTLPKGKAVRWNLWIHEAIRDELATLAAERDISPSQLVQELLWNALSDRRSSTP